MYLFEEQLRNYVDVSVRGEVDQPHHHNSPSRKSHLERDPRVGFIIEQVPLPRVPRGYAPPTDPEWTNQWTLVYIQDDNILIFLLEQYLLLTACVYNRNVVLICVVCVSTVLCCVYIAKQRASWP